MKNKFKKSVFLLSTLMMLSVGAGIINVAENIVNVAEAAEETIVSYTFSEHYSSNTTLTDIVINLDANISITFAKNSGSTAPQYYSNGYALRVYGKNSVKIYASNEDVIMNSITFTFTTKPTSSNSSVDNGSLDYNTSIWTGNSSSMTITNTASSGNWRISALSVSYVNNSSGNEPEVPVENYSATLNYNIVGKENEIVNYTSKQDYTLPVLSISDNPGNKFLGWYVGNDTTTAITELTSEHNGLTINALWEEVVVETYTLLTEASQLAANKKLIIVAKDYNYALSSTQNNNNRGQASVTKLESNIQVVDGEDGIEVLTLEQGTIDGTFALYTGEGYLYAAGSGSSNYLRTETEMSANSSWKIELSEDGIASIVAQGSNSNKYMQYNQSSSLFSCYASAGQKAISIYMLSSDIEQLSDVDKIKKLNTESSLGFTYDITETNTSGESSTKYTFADYTAGAQYADNEEHILDNNTTIYTTDCHFTSELRIYSSTSYNGYAVLNSSSVITKIIINAGYKVDTLNVYGSVNGDEWTIIQGVSITSTSYADYELDIDVNLNYTYLKFDVEGSNQVRLKYITLTTAGSKISEYTFSNVRMRFQATIPSELYENVKDKITDAGFYITLKDSELTPVKISGCEFPEDESADRFIMGAMRVPEENFDAVLIVEAYFTIDGTEVRCVGSNYGNGYSVKTLAAAYTGEVYDKLPDDEHRLAISAFNTKYNASEE